MRLAREKMPSYRTAPKAPVGKSSKVLFSSAYISGLSAGNRAGHRKRNSADIRGLHTKTSCSLASLKCVSAPFPPSRVTAAASELRAYCAHDGCFHALRDRGGDAARTDPCGDRLTPLPNPCQVVRTVDFDTGRSDSTGVHPQTWVNGNGNSYIYFGSGQFDGQGSGHDFYGTVREPSVPLTNGPP